MKSRWFIVLVILTIPAIVYWLVMSQLDTFNKPQKTLLARVGDECAGIADNAVANMSAIVEFQKLEIQGRKMNVMRRCMTDKGFIENPSWIAYVAPIAHANAIKQNISEDEAIENLRREHMMIYNESSRQPIYWLHHS